MVKELHLKPGKLAVTACGRKLQTILGAMAKPHKPSTRRFIWVDF